MADKVNVAALRRLHERWRGGNVLHGEQPAVRDFEKQLEHAIPALLDVAEAARVIDERIDFAHDLRRCDMMDSTLPRERQMVCTCGVWEATAALEAALAKLQWEEP